MAQIYAALKMEMGSWLYYSVKMKMSEVASEIKFAYEVNDDKTLDTAIQREIGTSRAGTQIVNYLVQNEHRFFNSLVVAALDGNPSFSAVSIEDDPKFEFFRDKFKDTFGILSFDDSLKTYALDGQHRLYAIKKLIDGSASLAPPPGFHDETINVIFVVPADDVARDEFLKAYRRLFSSLNRHAKSTAKNTNIIMDEDDRFAIVTRRLFSDFDFFKWNGHDEDPKIDTEATGENVRANSTAWATLVGLYNMNISLLWDKELQSKVGVYKASHDLIQETPADEDVENLYGYLEKIWDALLMTLPVLEADPSKKRKFVEDSDEFEDNLLFRPIGQTGILAPVARRLLNHFDVGMNSDEKDFRAALKPLAMIDWNLQSDLWRDLLTIRNPDGKWIMRNEDRQRAIEKGRAIVMWLCGLEDLNEDQLETLKQDWSFMLLGSEEDRNLREEDTFSQLLNLREEILSECFDA